MKETHLVTPFFISEGVDGEMDESVELQLVPGAVGLMGVGPYGLGGPTLVAVAIVELPKHRDARMIEGKERRRNWRRSSCSRFVL